MLVSGNENEVKEQDFNIESNWAIL
jgi:hypothetical protein